MEPGDKAVDAEHRQPQVLGQGAGIGHHVGAFEQDRADVGMLRDQRVAGIEDVALGSRRVEPRLVVEDDAGEFAAVVGADDRRLRVGAGGDQVLAASGSRR